MKKTQYLGKKITVMGLGLHGGGVSVAKFFAKRGANVTVTDLKTRDDLLDSISTLKNYKNVRYVLGQHKDADFIQVDLIVKNPAVPAESKFLQIAKNNKVEIQMAEGIFFNLCPTKNIIGVTGTKGKTTTSYLIYELLKSNGLKVHMAGNMKIPVLDILPKIKKDDWVVLEFSSWQCEALEQNKISPKVAVITNISQDHLNRYKSYRDYAFSKTALFKYQSPKDILILNKDTGFFQNFKKSSRSKIIWVSPKMREIKADRIYKQHNFYKQYIKKACLRGDHNFANSLQALAVSYAFNLDFTKSKKAIFSFKGVPYRMQSLGKVLGVEFINDTSSTVPSSALAAMDYYKKVNPILILGGADKSLEYKDLVKRVKKEKFKYVLLKGTATDKLISLGLNKKVVFDNFRNAVLKSFEWAIQVNGIVLLSPGAASFGMFKHEFDRGDQFNEIFNELKSAREITFKTDSRKIKPGDTFIAISGVKFNGHDYIESAIKNGASFVVGEVPFKRLKLSKNFKYTQVKNTREYWAKMCAEFYKNPQEKLKVVGVTGTDGKTTTCGLIYDILKFSGKKVGLLTTVKAVVNEEVIDTGFHVTTPDPDQLFKILNKMVGQEIEYVVLEVTSHALVQRRVFGINFVSSIVTNVTSEHLDLHKSYDRLVKDKALIFKQSDTVFLNKLGRGFNVLNALALESHRRYKKPKKLFCFDQSINRDKISPSFSRYFPGGYNVQNALGAIAVCKYLGIKDLDIKKGLLKSRPQEGRFKRVKNLKGLNIIVDFAHTENSMYSVLTAVRELKQKKEKIITVFGCASERDTNKRPKMGLVASKLSNTVILTSEDPRFENPHKIINEISLGAPKYKFIKISNRKKAIKKALEIAKKGDWILILGKGHEKSFNIKGVEYPWSDIVVVKQLINFPRS